MIKEEVLKTEELLEDIYGMAEISRPMKLFRFPYFDKGGHQNGQAYEEDWQNYTEIDKMQAIEQFLKDQGFRQPRFKNKRQGFFKDMGFQNTPDMALTYDQCEYNLGNADAMLGSGTEEGIMALIDRNDPQGMWSLPDKKTSEIMLIHDHEHTTELFYKLIDQYIARDIKFILPDFN
jgi:hypothetical protein